MNIIDIQNDLKGLSEQQLVQQMQNPTGMAPQYLVLSEITRRKRMRDDYAKRQSEGQGTVAEEAIAAAGAPSQGIASLASGMAPKTDMTQNTGVVPGGNPVGPSPPEPMAEGYYGGGMVKKKGFAEGGTVRVVNGRVVNDVDANGVPFYNPRLTNKGFDRTVPYGESVSGTIDRAVEGGISSLKSGLETGQGYWDKFKHWEPSAPNDLSIPRLGEYAAPVGGDTSGWDRFKTWEPGTPTGQSIPRLREMEPEVFDATQDFVGPPEATPWERFKYWEPTPPDPSAAFNDVDAQGRPFYNPSKPIPESGSTPYADTWSGGIDQAVAPIVDFLNRPELEPGFLRNGTAMPVAPKADAAPEVEGSPELSAEDELRRLTFGLDFGTEVGARPTASLQFPTTTSPVDAVADTAAPASGGASGAGSGSSRSGSASTAIPSGSPFQEYEKFLAEKLADLDRREEQNKWLALAKAGAALAASRAPSFGSALGEAFNVGIESLGEAYGSNEEREMLLMAQKFELMGMNADLAMQQARMAMAGKGSSGSGATDPFGGMKIKDRLDEARMRRRDVQDKLEILRAGGRMVDDGSGFKTFVPLTPSEKTDLESEVRPLIQMIEVLEAPLNSFTATPPPAAPQVSGGSSGIYTLGTPTG